MNISNSQNWSSQSGGHRFCHWFITCLSSDQIFFRRLSYMICVLETEMKRKILLKLIEKKCNYITRVHECIIHNILLQCLLIYFQTINKQTVFPFVKYYFFNNFNRVNCLILNLARCCVCVCTTKNNCNSHFWFAIFPYPVTIND